IAAPAAATPSGRLFPSSHAAIALITIQARTQARFIQMTARALRMSFGSGVRTSSMEPASCDPSDAEPTRTSSALPTVHDLRLSPMDSVDRRQQFNDEDLDHVCDSAA